MTTTDTSALEREVSLHRSLTQAILSGLEEDQILHLILSSITHRRGLDLDRTCLFLVNEGAKEMRCACAIGPVDAIQAKAPKPDEPFHPEALLNRYRTAKLEAEEFALQRRLSGAVIPLSANVRSIGAEEQDVPLQALIVRAAQRREILASDRPTAVYLPLGDLAGEPLRFAHMALVPLAIADRVCGVLVVDNQFSDHPLTPADLRALEPLANLAAIAVEHCRLHQRMREMSALDGLTGAFNRRHFDIRLEQEVARCRRESRNLSMILYDIDHLRDCNEKHGHQTGDRVLKETAGLLLEQVRSEDIVARWGGEEFAILLTGNATPEEAMKVAEKLRAAIERAAIGGLPAGAVTVSGGCACSKATVVDPANLSRAASDALQKAKQAGRNRISPAGSC